MTSIAPFVTAKVVSDQDTRIAPGKGYVEKTEKNDRVVIALASGKITAQCTSGSLSAGDIVNVKFNGSDLIIEQLSPRGYGVVHDTLNLGDGFRKQTEPVAGTADGNAVCAPLQKAETAFPLKGARLPAGGFYFFETAAKGISWLSDFSAGFDKKQQRALLEKFAREPVVIQVVETENQGAKAIILSPESGEARLAAFVREQLRCVLWESAISEGGLMTLLRDRGAIRASRILALDTIICAGRSPALFPRPGDMASGTFTVATRPGDVRLFMQWLNVAMDETVPLSVFSSCPPALRSAEIPPLLDKLTSTLAAETEGNYPPLLTEEDYSISRTVVGDGRDKYGALPGIFERIGLNFENVLSRSGLSAGGADIPAPSVKLQLLRLENELQSAAPETTDETVARPALVLHRSTQALSAALLEASGRLLTGLLSRETEWPFPRVNDGAEPPASPPRSAEIESPEALRQRMLKLAALCEILSREISNRAEKIRDSIRLLEPSAKVAQGGAPGPGRENSMPSDTANTLDSAVKSFTMRAMAAFGKIAEALDAALTGLSRRPEGFVEGAAPSPRPPGDPSGGQAAPENRQNARTQALVQASLREVARLASGELRDLIGRADRLAETASKLLDSANAGSEGRESKPGLETARQLVEGALQRIESMQVTAKPTVSGDVRQQIVTVPMNIDGSWNDVVMKFVRADGSAGKKGGRKNIFVTVNVAPSALGEISASIDYKEIGNCSLRMDFQKDRTHSWFETNRQGIAEAFSGLGFKNLNIEMRKTVRDENPARAGSKTVSRGAIDIVA
jgi:hypothetical protein